ncbi:unnamed protein product, partial [Arabidopsis halleri]
MEVEIFRNCSSWFGISKFNPFLHFLTPLHLQQPLPQNFYPETSVDSHSSPASSSTRSKPHLLYMKVQGKSAEE